MFHLVRGMRQAPAVSIHLMRTFDLYSKLSARFTSACCCYSLFTNALVRRIEHVHVAYVIIIIIRLIPRLG